MTAEQSIQVEPGLEKAYAILESMLVDGEKILFTAVQRRLFALLHRRVLIAATSGRFIGISRGLIGGFTPVDVRWQDIKSAHIKAGIFGSTLRVTALSMPDLASGGTTIPYEFTGLRKDEAQSVYRICQAQEQAWREKRRFRELEEHRAKSGGFQNSVGTDSSSSTANEDPAERLKKAKAMLDAGLISDSEYETIKARVISQF